VLLYTRFWEYPLRWIVEFLLVLKARQVDARLLVIGDGEQGEASALRRMAARADLANLADIRGWADRSIIDAALAAADVAIVPFADTLMNRAKCSAKLLELLASGVPVVASRVGQAREYIDDGRTGLLVAQGGVPLATAAIELLADERHRRAIGEAATRATSVWSWSKLAVVAEDAYQVALGSAG
jgi:glycosyltransferase involved in cell wall biosynthesis